MDKRPPTAAEFAAELADVEIAEGWNRTQFLIRDSARTDASGVAPATPGVTRMPDAVPRGMPSTLFSPGPPPVIGAAAPPAPRLAPPSPPPPQRNLAPASTSWTAPTNSATGGWTPPPADAVPSAPPPPPIQVAPPPALQVASPPAVPPDPEPPAASPAPPGEAPPQQTSPADWAAFAPPGPGGTPPTTSPRTSPTPSEAEIAPLPEPAAADTGSVPVWAVRSPATASAPALPGPRFSSDLSMDPMSLHPRATLRAGASAVVVDDHQLRLRTWFKWSSLAWSDVLGFEAQLDDTDANAGPERGRVVALTTSGPVELAGTRRQLGDLRYVHALLDAYRIRALRIAAQ
jgi:hypothetical protein